MRRILLTGFEPFGGDLENASLAIVRRVVEAGPVQGPRGPIELLAATLPVVFDAAPLLEAVRAARPDALLCVGEAGGRGELTPERTARNRIDARIPDNAGRQPRGVPIDPAGPPRRGASLDAEAWTSWLAEAGAPARESDDAGGFVCNFVAYHAYGLGLPALFLHVPALRSSGRASVGAETDPGRSIGPACASERPLREEALASAIRGALTASAAAAAR